MANDGRDWGYEIMMSALAGCLGFGIFMYVNSMLRLSTA